jgi:hypothetical protein
MADKHRSGNPQLVEQHKNIQREGDKELAQGGVDPGHSAPERKPGRGKPDKEEGVGTVQNQKR